MDDLLIRVLTRLLRVHDELGECAFEDAAQRALVGIGVTVMQEAEHRAALQQSTSSDGNVLPFPLDRVRDPTGDRPAPEPVDD